MGFAKWQLQIMHHHVTRLFIQKEKPRKTFFFIQNNQKYTTSTLKLLSPPQVSIRLGWGLPGPPPHSQRMGGAGLPASGREATGDGGGGTWEDRDCSGYNAIESPSL